MRWQLKSQVPLQRDGVAPGGGGWEVRRGASSTAASASEWYVTLE